MDPAQMLINEQLAEEYAPRARPVFQELHGQCSTISIEKPEYRGMSIPQIKNVAIQGKRRCVPEGWTDIDGTLLTPDKVNLYHIKNFVIIPVTEDRKCSYVEAIAEGPQIPQWFVSHWWGEPIDEFIQCLEQHAKDHKLDVNTTYYWICGYANNQWQVDLGDTLEESPFFKAMEKADGTVSILDKEGIVFSRMWCGYELYLSLLNEKGYKWCVYTSIERFAVGLTEGLAPDDDFSGDKFEREEDFPVHLLEDALRIDIKNAQASMAADKDKILQSIGKDIEKLNSVLKGRFAASGLRKILEEGNESAWLECLRSIADSQSKVLDFSFSECETFNESRREQLRKHIDWECLETISLDFDGLNMGNDGVEDIANRWLPFDKIRSLGLDYNQIGDEGAVALAKAVKQNETLQDLTLARNEIGDQGAVALMEAVKQNETLYLLDLAYNNISEETEEKIRGSEVGDRIRFNYLR